MGSYGWRSWNWNAWRGADGEQPVTDPSPGEEEDQTWGEWEPLPEDVGVKYGVENAFQNGFNVCVTA